MKRNKFKFLFSILSLTTFMSIIPITIVACSPKKPTPSDNVENPPETPNPDETTNPDVPNITPPKDDEISSSGGEYNGLNVSNYLEVVKALNLSSSTNIVELNDNNLNNLLHQTYPELNVNIQNGSNQYNGELNLKLTNNQSREIINNNIVISGFNVNKYTNFTVIDAEINLEKWFNNFQPINNQNINNVKPDLDLLSRFEINIDDAITINNTNYQDQFKITPKFSIENNNLKIDFNIEQCFKEYNNGEWVIDSYSPLAIKNPLNEYDVQLPTLNQLFQFMMQQIKIIDNNAYNFYPSYFMGIGLYSIKIQQSQTAIFNYLNINQIIDKYKSTYFPNNQYNFLINSNSNFSANDSIGQLSFSIYVKNLDNTDIDNISASHQLVLSGFKKLNLNKQYNNSVSVENGSNLYNSLSRIFTNEIQQVQNDKQTIENVEKIGLNSLLSTYFGLIYMENMDDDQLEAKVNNINTNYKFSLFGTYISNFNTDISIDSLKSNNFNPSLGLYNLGSNSEDIIYLKSIEINLEANKNSISLDNNNLPEIRIFGNIAITLSNNEIINQNVVLVCKIVNSIF